MKNRLAVLALLCCPLPAAAPEQAETPPNFLIILCDDLGYGDLGCYGHPKIRTPHLDKLAREGLRCTLFYAAAPVCSPSRAGLLTGRNPNRFGVYTWISEGNPMHLPRTEWTLAALLKQIGYRTGLFGKWHLNGLFNSASQPQPGDFGFDHWFATQNNAGPSHENPANFVRNGQPVGKQQGFSCQLVVDEALAWLAKNKDGPFFMHVCFHEPHEPVASPADLVASYADARNADEAQYFANVTNMDRAVGRLLEALEMLKLAHNTVVLFTSDNGPEGLLRYAGARRSYGSAGPLRSKKLSLYEGGIRVPAILRWPGKTRPGQKTDEPVSGLDVLPTLGRAAGARIPRTRTLDGTDLSPIFQGRAIERKTPLFWFYYRALDEPRAALRSGDWMLLARCAPLSAGAGGSLAPGDVAKIKNARLTTFELYNLKTDPGERKDVAKEEPARLESMSDALRRLHAEIIAEGPTWTFAVTKKN